MHHSSERPVIFDSSHHFHNPVTVGVINHLFETLRRAVCNLFCFFSLITITHPWRGIGSTTATLSFQLLWRYCLTATRIPASDRPSETKLHKQTHQKRKTPHTKTHSGLGRSPFYCFFFTVFEFLVLPGPCLVLHLPHYSISTGPPKTARQHPPRRNESRKQSINQFLDRFIWLNWPEAEWPFWKQFLATAAE